MCNTPFISLKLCVCVGVGVLLICEYVGVGVFKGVWVSVWMCHTCVGVRVGVKKRARKEHTSKITHIGHCIAAPGSETREAQLRTIYDAVTTPAQCPHPQRP